MKRIALAAAAALCLALPATAQDKEGIVSFSSLKPSAAIALAQGALDACHEAGYQVAVTVVDRFGETQVVMGDRFAGPHTIPTATAKAWTALSFRGATLELDERIASGELSRGLRDIPGALFLGGGVPVISAGTIVGGIGVSGAPEPTLDEECAEAGIETIYDLLEF